VKTLILGGARSGKSALAERLAGASGLGVCYLATARAGDEEMRQRILTHQQRRPPHWSLVEEPIHLADALKRQVAENRCLLVDCITLWLSNLMLDADGESLERERRALLETLPELPGRILLVSNEVGMGIVPMGELSRRFQDQAGWLNQQLASRCERVILTVAGLPHILKGEPL